MSSLPSYWSIQWRIMFPCNCISLCLPVSNKSWYYLLREREGTLKHWEKWYLNISQYEVYRHDDPIMDQVLHDLATLPVVYSSKYVLLLQKLYSDMISKRFLSISHVKRLKWWEWNPLNWQNSLCLLPYKSYELLEQLSGGTQIKLKITYSDDLEGLWKPMRLVNETQAVLVC